MKKRSITTTIALMLLAATVSFSITLSVCSRRFDDQLKNLDALISEHEKIAEVQTAIDQYYVNEYDREAVTEGAAVGMVAYLGDRWSYYLNPEQYQEFQKSLNNQMVGIGVNVLEDTETGGILVVGVYKKSPAEKGGLKVHDIVTHVDGIAVPELGYEQAVNMIRGHEGTKVKLTVLSPNGKQTVREITRRQLEVESVTSQILDGNIGYIQITNFDLNVDKKVIDTVEKMQKANVNGLIFDVRNNPGGFLQTMLNMLDQLLPDCVMLKQVDKAGNEEVYRSDAEEIQIPMAVLVNGNSISAAEFFAASLQEHGKGIVVGMPTTGKGCSQTPIPLSDGSAIVLSTDKYYTAGGIDLAAQGGIQPDVKVELTNEEMRANYTRPLTEDRQVQAAIEVLTK
ncbi:MAG: S41 family peptidase [Ruminococcaceae bacterium]|nr:S41 family peptidase [Oscillospiraceae bacterium]